MFLFAHLWRIFESELDNDIDDKRIFKHEFMHSRPSLTKINGADISDEITDEMWEREFATIDVNKNGFIGFAEFCKYVTKFIVTPKNYIKDIKHEKHDMYDDNEEEMYDSMDEGDATAATDSIEVKESGVSAPLIASSTASGNAEDVATTEQVVKVEEPADTAGDAAVVEGTTAADASDANP